MANSTDPIEKRMKDAQEEEDTGWGPSYSLPGLEGRSFWDDVWRGTGMNTGRFKGLWRPSKWRLKA